MAESNIVKFHKNRQLNIGLIIFGIIFIYLIATIVMYLTAPHITVYEVRQGSILKDTGYTGLALRDEVVVQAAGDGYINYYAPDCSKVKVGSDIYTLSEQKMVFDETTDESADITSTKEKNLIFAIQMFNYDYIPSDFDETYRLKSELQDSIGSMNNRDKLKQLNDILAQNSNGITLYPSSDDGLLVYGVDGMESLTKETVSFSDLEKSGYKKHVLTNNEKVKAGDNIYKIVMDDAWTLMIELDENTANQLQDKTYVKVHFTKDNQTLWADLVVEELEGHTVAYLHFENSMVRYAAERYIDIKLILEDEAGLKIPKTSKTQKEFYAVPKSYITLGGNSSDSGILLQSKDADGNLITEFTTVQIYYEDEEVVYLDPNDFDEGTILIMPDSNTTYALSERRKMDGVFCINKGYAVFKQIQILCESDSYYIVEEGNRYGLSNYDHIALDSSNIKENDVVF